MITLSDLRSPNPSFIAPLAGTYAFALYVDDGFDLLDTWRTSETMRYEGMVIRPPSEAESLLLQVTYGCSHNRCTFCPTYLDKPFHMRPFEEIEKDIAWAKRHIGHPRRIFLCDGDAMVLSTERLLRILRALLEAFPDLARVGTYANARDILSKGDSELRTLAEHRLGIAYMGLESGSDEVLRRVKKGATASDMAEAVRKAQAAGIKVSAIVLLGLGGTELSEEHARETARIVNQMNPRFLSFLTLMLVPGTELYDLVRRGEFELPSPVELIREMRRIVEGLELSGTVFRTNHASNYAPIGGRFPQDRDRILEQIDAFLAGRVRLRPEFLRGL